jgi:uncharacterized protein (TIGR02246 family)
MTKLVARIIGMMVITCVTTMGQQKLDPGVEQLLADYETSWAKGDAEGLASLYTQNAIRMGPEGPVVGRQAIQTMLERNFSGVWKGTKVTITGGRIESVSADVRVHEGTFEVSGQTGAPQKGRYLNTLVRQGAQWRIAGLAPIPETPATR